jgi:2-methylcitrate dehydratase PrpD
MTKHLNAGKPAHDGVLAVLLAHRGFSAPTNILEGEDDLCHVLSRKFDENQITDGLGERFEILNNSFKPYPSCRQTHAVIDACLDIFRKPPFRSSDVKEIICEVNPLALEVVGIINPRDANEAKFSRYYCAARGLMGDVSLGSFGIQEIENEKGQQLMKCIQIRTNPSFSITNAQVEVNTTDGRKT